jgi:hypothetical protein
MIYWIINALLWAFWNIIYKKSIGLANWKISDKYYQFIWNLLMLIFLPLIYLYFEFQWINLLLFSLLFIWAILWIISSLLDQYAYKNEKISVLIPFWEFRSIFTIFIWFFVLSDNSLISFIFAMFAWIVLVIWWIDFKNFKINKYCLSITASALFWAIQNVIFWYLLISLSEYSVLFFNVAVTFFILFIITLLSKDFYQYKNINKKIASYIAFEQFTWLLIGFITLFLIKELWLVQAILIWMLYLITSLIFSLIFLKNIPSKKEIIIVILIFTFVTFWTIFW